ncbi:MAG: hypothetical protein LBQ81_09800 [Zoogloeaceae bacterium]|jgi:hypothetical protein|nr:hypothetical protein [Zoogloeaceae bacterium]
MQTTFALVDAPSIGRVVRVREMTVAEIRALMRLPGAADKAVLLIMSDVTLPELDAMAAEDVERLLKKAVEINAAFYGSEDRGQRTEDSQLPAQSAANQLSSELDRAVSRVIRCDHPNAWDYPWGVFKAAVDELAASDGERGRG